MTTASCVLGALAVFGLVASCLLLFASMPDSGVVPKCLLGIPLLLVMTPVLSPYLVKTRQANTHSSCWVNLKQIQGAKETWALEHKQPRTAIPKDSDLFGEDRNQHYMRSKPVCASGGQYTIGPVGVNATCSLPEKWHYGNLRLIENSRAAAMILAFLAAGLFAVAVVCRLIRRSRSGTLAIAGAR